MNQALPPLATHLPARAAHSENELEMDNSQLPTHYLTGFGNEHETEAVPGSLPVGQFNPQKAPRGLYTEQISTTAFTAPRACNRRTWLYRIRPSVQHQPFRPLANQNLCTAPLPNRHALPYQQRWAPQPLASEPTDFIDGLTTLAVNGDAASQKGSGIHLYAANQSMSGRYFYNADGELLVVPQAGELLFKTECGQLVVGPGEIAVIPRGFKFQVLLLDDSATGYVCENYGSPLELPERGPVGSNGFANQRDFLYPTAQFEDIDGDFELVTKFAGQVYSAPINHSPLNVVAWVGNSAPYKYDLSRFNVINTVSFDHPDPSIFTVLTSASETPGVANLDFVIFPPRWMVAEHSFRPPWFHRNIMSEFMGLVHGVYDAKEHGFLPGGCSLHNCMSAHGPEVSVYEAATNTELSPTKYENTLAFMFESRYPFVTTEFARHSPTLQSDYMDCWQNFNNYFSESNT